MQGRVKKRPEKVKADPPHVKSVVPAAQGDIVFYSTLAAIAAFIPLPFVDDYADQQIRQRMIRRLFTVHGVPLNEGDTGSLYRPSTRHRISRLSRKAVMAPTKRLFRRALFKTLLFLDIKYCVDAFGAMYHTGYLFDYALQQGWARNCRPDSIRTAVDRVCAQTGTSPVNHAVTGTLRQSANLFLAASRAMYGILFSRTGKEGEYFETIEKEQEEVKTLSAMLQSALNLVPPDYFKDLQQRLELEMKKNQQHKV